MASDAIGTVASAALGTSTVTSFIESAALTIVSAMMM
jgi:xanthine/uracil/vitamin C permease (AzgA family)